MQEDASPISEQRRVESLHDLAILDTPPEPEFDDLVELAAVICGAPISLLSLIDDRRQWFKAKVGFEATESPREVAFCNHTIQGNDLLLVEDACEDPRFTDNPFVTGKTGLRFYAGMPVFSLDGQAVGALCVADRVPRTLTQEQCDAIKVLAAQINARLELRLQRCQLERTLKEAEAVRTRLQASERRFQTFMDCAPLLSYLKDADGRMVYYNRTMAAHFGVSREALLHKTDAELWPAELATRYRKHDLEVLQSGQMQVIDEHTQNPDASLSIWRSYKFPVDDGDGRCLVGGFSVEITAELRREHDLAHYREELEAANRQLSELASRDELTGLANRRSFDQQSEAAFQFARRFGRPLSLLLMDIDDFKQHNDRFGHGHGDQVLRLLARCLRQSLRDGDVVARYGGEEFAILLPDTGEEASGQLAERLLCAVRASSWPQAPVTVSVGVSSLDGATPDLQRLVTLADEALYAAKHAGKDQAVKYRAVYQRALASAACDPGISRLPKALQNHDLTRAVPAA